MQNNQEHLFRKESLLWIVFSPYQAEYNRTLTKPFVFMFTHDHERKENENEKRSAGARDLQSLGPAGDVNFAGRIGAHTRLDFCQKKLESDQFLRLTIARISIYESSSGPGTGYRVPVPGMTRLRSRPIIIARND